MKTRYQNIPVEIQWDGFKTVSPQTAAKISVTGKVPKQGYEVKTILTKIDLNGNEVFMWLSRTRYNGKAYYYIY